MGARRKGVALAKAAAPLGAYLAAALIAGLLLPWSMAATVGGAVAAVAWAAIWRRSRRRVQDPMVTALPGPLPRRFVLMCAAAFLLVFLGGQSTAQWWLQALGSESFDGVQENLSAQSLGTALLLVLVVAPIAEEALLRGSVYPALRRAFSPWAAAALSALVFAALHGNMVQAIATVPLGLLSAVVYEATRRLGPSVVLHLSFNAVSLIVPAQLVRAIAHPIIWVPLLALLAWVLVALFRSAPARVGKGPGISSGGAARDPA